MLDPDKRTFEITKHAKERYVQRIMKYSSPQDIGVYIAQNDKIIQERINKMISYSTHIYSGRVRDGNYVHVLVHDAWVIMTDQNKQKVITLYKISLIDEDDEFNKLFIEKMKAKISDISLKLEDTLKRNKAEKDALKEKIDYNKKRIKEYQVYIKDYTNTNDAYVTLIENYDTEANVLHSEVKQAVENLVSQKIF